MASIHRKANCSRADAWGDGETKRKMRRLKPNRAEALRKGIISKGESYPSIISISLRPEVAARNVQDASTGRNVVRGALDTRRCALIADPNDRVTSEPSFSEDIRGEMRKRDAGKGVSITEHAPAGSTVMDSQKRAKGLLAYATGPRLRVGYPGSS